MKDICRICARDLCGNQRRWIFHTASKLNLQVLLSHVLGKEVLRDGRTEFACSKCTFMLERIYRFDTVIARIEALSVERLQKLVLEKDRLKLCVANLYRKNNTDFCTESKDGDSTVDVSSLPDACYAALLQDDFEYSGFESWAEHDDRVPEHSNCQPTEGTANRSKRCHCCAVLRVPDADYEAICKVPRKLARSISTVTSNICPASIFNEEVPQPILTDVKLDKMITERDGMERVSSESSESLHRATEDSPLLHREEERVEGSSEDPKWDFCIHNNTMQSCSLQINKLDAALSLVKAFDYKPVQSPKGSRIPVKSSPPCARSTSLPTDGSSLPHLLIADFGLMNMIAQPVNRKAHDFIPELLDLQELWQDVYEDYIPLRMEAEEMHETIEEQNQSIDKLQAMLHQSQLDNFQMPGMLSSTHQQVDFFNLQYILFCAQLKLQMVQRMLRRSERQLTDARRVQWLLESDLKKAQKQKATTWTHNQNLHIVLLQLQGQLQDVSQQLEKVREQKNAVIQEQELTIQHLKQTLLQKEQVLQEHICLLQYQAASQKEPRIPDLMLQKLYERIRDRDKALERAVDEKYCALEEKEQKLQQVQLAIREKEHDLERLHSLLSSNEETINSLDSMLKSKDFEIGHISTMYNNLQWLQNETEEKYKNTIKERETFIQQLQTSLYDRHKELETIVTDSLKKSSVVNNELVEQLQLCLQNKEKMLQNVLSDRNQQTAEHEREILKLLKTVNIGDQLNELVLTLERLVLERAKLNSALLSERQIYSNLVNLHSQPKSCEEGKALQFELEAVQMLRGRLEETLGQSLQQLSNLEAEKRAPIDFGGGDRACFRAPHACILNSDLDTAKCDAKGQD